MNGYIAETLTHTHTQYNTVTHLLKEVLVGAHSLLDRDRGVDVCTVFVFMLRNVVHEAIVISDTTIVVLFLVPKEVLVDAQSLHGGVSAQGLLVAPFGRLCVAIHVIF